MKYIKLYLAIVISVCIVFSSAAAEETMLWKDCVREAKNNHPDLVSSAEKIKQSKASKEITRSAYLPQITGDASEVTSKGATFGSSGGGGQSDIQVGSSGRNYTTSYDYSVTGQQLLFDGFKTSYDLSTAERNISASRYNYDVTSSNVRLRLRTAYVNLLTAQDLLTISEEIEARRKQNLELVKLRYEGGREHRGSLLTSEADLAQAAFDVNQARRSIFLAQWQLTKELGRGKFIPMKAEGNFAVVDADRERPDFVKLCYTNPLLQQLVAQKEAAKYGVKSARAGFYPQVFASGTMGNTNVDAFPDKNEWSVGTSLTFPFFDGGNTIASVAKARAILGQAEADERSGRDGVVYTLSNTWTTLQDTMEKVGVTKKSLDAAEERAKIAEAEYSIGLLIYDNWIIIENNLVTAKRTYLSSERDALIAEANWIQAKGETLDYDK
jgi:outer membrane protein TolC